MAGDGLSVRAEGDVQGEDDVAGSEVGEGGFEVGGLGGVLVGGGGGGGKPDVDSETGGGVVAD